MTDVCAVLRREEGGGRREEGGGGRREEGGGRREEGGGRREEGGGRRKWQVGGTIIIISQYYDKTAFFRLLN